MFFCLLSKINCWKSMIFNVINWFSINSRSYTKCMVRLFILHSFLFKFRLLRWLINVWRWKLWRLIHIIKINWNARSRLLIHYLFSLSLFCWTFNFRLRFSHLKSCSFEAFYWRHLFFLNISKVFLYFIQVVPLIF